MTDKSPRSGPEGRSSLAPVGPKVVPGDVLAGKFRVERIVGRGGMGVVVEATNIQLDQRIALKLLAGAESAASVERFTREARAAAKLKSEHVARVYDVGKDPTHGPFIVMELLEGSTLAEVLRDSGKLPLHRAVEYVIDACEGLAEAHARGIVHQDVKPANLFLVTGNDGRLSIKLLDFGIATMRSKERGAEPTASHSSLGTPAYLAPEQIRGVTIDHRADVWALGVVLYELLVGDRPFRATRFTELVTKIIEAEPTSIPDDIEAPAAITAAIARCLEKDPAKRYTSTGHLALALLPFARKRAHAAAARAVAHVKTAGLDAELEMPSSMPPPPSDAEVEAVSSSTMPLRAPSVPSFSSAPTHPPPSDRGLPWPLIGGAAALVVVGVLAFLRCGSSPTTADPTTSGSAPVVSASPHPSVAAVTEPSASAGAASSANPASSASAASAVDAGAKPKPWLFPRAPHSATSTQPAPSKSSGDSEIRLNR